MNELVENLRAMHPRIMTTRNADEAADKPARMVITFETDEEAIAFHHALVVVMNGHV